MVQGLKKLALAASLGIFSLTALSNSANAFDPATEGLAFRNYSIWGGSSLPEKLQVGHCTGIVLFARQVYYWGEFRPDLARVSPQEYYRILKAIFDIPTQTPPESRSMIVIPGYSHLFELSADPVLEEQIKKILWDAL